MSRSLIEEFESAGLDGSRGSATELLPSTIKAADIRLTERAVATLRKTGYQRFRNLDARGADGCVELRGCVPTYHLRQLAIHVVSSLAGVRRVRDLIEVVRDDGASAGRTKKQIIKS